ncbi:hypothetical protein PAMP_011410 [Pampus punctatissimus]
MGQGPMRMGQGQHVSKALCAGDGLYTRKDPQTGRNNPSVSRAQAPERTGFLNQGRRRTLFARRGQYERQRIHVPKPNVIRVPPNVVSVPTNVPPPPPKDPAMPVCSQLTQSCLPQSGCCDPCATCHCRFFNAICFCRRTNSKYESKSEKKT